MNKKRKNDIKNETLRLKLVLKDIEKILSDEEYYYDSIPENLQSGIRYDISEESIDKLNESIELLSELIDVLSSI